MATRRRANGAGIHFYYEGTSFEGHIELNIALALRRDGWNGSSLARRLMWDQGRLATWRDFVFVSECSSQEFLLSIQCGIRAGENSVFRVGINSISVRISDARGAWGLQLDQDQHLIPWTCLSSLEWWSTFDGSELVASSVSVQACERAKWTAKI